MLEPSYDASIMLVIGFYRSLLFHAHLRMMQHGWIWQEGTKPILTISEKIER